MPIQAAAAPWDELADAYERLHEAERHGPECEQDAARDEVRRCRERMGLIGTLLVSLALEHGSMQLQRKLSAVFADLSGREGYKLAQRAMAWISDTRDHMDALTQRVRELERRADELTHGIGEPRTL